MPAYPNPGADAEMLTDGPMPEEKAMPPGEKDEAPEAASAILPKEILQGKQFNVGDEIVLKIDRIGENDVEVSYASEKGNEENPGMEKEAGEEMETTPTSRADTGGGMASMME